MIKGMPVTRSNFGDADEVRILVQKSKADIYNKGEACNHFALSEWNHGEKLCVVEA